MVLCIQVKDLAKEIKSVRGSSPAQSKRPRKFKASD